MTTGTKVDTNLSLLLRALLRANSVDYLTSASENLHIIAKYFFKTFFSVTMANQLFFVVFLNKYKKNLVVPASWCSPFDLAESVNVGLNRHTNRTIFYVNDITATPQFGIGIANSFNENVHGCHWGKIIRCFSELN